jgi:hypothetical protein
MLESRSEEENTRHGLEAEGGSTVAGRGFAAFVLAVVGLVGGDIIDDRSLLEQPVMTAVFDTGRVSRLEVWILIALRGRTDD